MIGYALSRTLDTALVLEALQMAITLRRPGPGVIHHSDQGVQYASGDYVDELKRRGFEISMARTANPYENAMMESFFKTLKHEEVYLCEYETFADMIARLPYFIEEVYNLKRLHSASPNDFENHLIYQEPQEVPRQTLLTLPVQSWGCTPHLSLRRPSQTALCYY